MLTTWHHISGVTRTDHEMHEAFEAHYDSVNPPILLGGVDGQEPVEVSASSVLKSRDPILYNDQFDRWVWLCQSGWSYEE